MYCASATSKFRRHGFVDDTKHSRITSSCNPQASAGARKTQIFWHQSEARTAATVWNWSGKTLSPGALLTVLYFSSFHIYFSGRLDFPSPPLSAPGSPRMKLNNLRVESRFFHLKRSDNTKNSSLSMKLDVRLRSCIVLKDADAEKFVANGHYSFTFLCLHSVLSSSTYQPTASKVSFFPPKLTFSFQSFPCQQTSLS